MTDQSFEVTPDLRLLVIVRHGEAKGHSAAGDEGRELTARGREDATDVGRWLVSQGVRSDVAIVSSATRTVQTWEAIRAGGVEADDVRVDRAIYNGTVEDLVEAISAVPDTARVALLVGHAPAVPDLALEVETRCDLPGGWSPATLGVISHPGPWSGFPTADTALVACRPRRR